MLFRSVVVLVQNVITQGPVNTRVMTLKDANRRKQLLAATSAINKLQHVSFEFKTKKNNRSSTIKRGGPGFKGSYEELKDKITKYSRQATEDVARTLGITWDEMIVYYVVSGNTINKLFSVIGHNQEGTKYMYDRYGTGLGAYSKLRPENGDAIFVQSFLHSQAR